MLGKRQFTATVYIIKEKKTLLIHHKKFKKWVPPGGHLFENELPSEAALREAKEETGLEIQLLRQENVWIEENSNGKSIARPYSCALYNIPKIKEELPHQHIDFIYVGEIIGGSERGNEKEINEMKWFSLKEIEDLLPDGTYKEVIPTFKQILEDFYKHSPSRLMSLQK